MNYTDLIFDLYGTLVDIHTEESEAVWEKETQQFSKEELFESYPDYERKDQVLDYPDFDDIETIKQQLDFISELGYTDIFTSIQLGDLGFENAYVQEKSSAMTEYTPPFDLTGIKD